MQKLFYPESIVVVGVSLNPMNLGHFIVSNLIEFGYRGAIHLLGRREGYIFGHRIRTKVEDIPVDVDLGVFLVPAAAVPDLFAGLAGRGLKRAVIQSGGFSELGDEGRRLEQRLLDIAATNNVRFVGPNCLGVINKHASMAVPFVPFKDLWRTGGVSVVSQSGGVGVSYLYRLVSENTGLSKFISVGNKINMDEVDYLKYLGQDKDTDIIVMYLEGFSRGRAFFNALRQVKKPVIVQKSNRTAMARGIAYSHTVALAADDRIVDAALTQGGAMHADNIEDAVALVKAFNMPRAKNRKIAIIARSGGHAVMAADAAADAGFELVKYPDTFLDSIENAFENTVITRQNPLDLGDVYDFDIYARVMQEACRIEEVGTVVIIQEYFAEMEAAQSRRLITHAKQLAQRYNKPVALVMFTDDKELAHVKQLYDYPIFTSISEAFTALAKVRDRCDMAAAPQVDTTAFVKTGPTGIFDMLAHRGLPVPEYGLVRSVEELEGLDLVFPVVAKVISSSLVHKTEANAVRLDIRDMGELKTVVGEFIKKFDLGTSGGVLVQHQVSGVVEAMIGGVRDPSFGPAIVFGLGGVMVEVFKDVRFLLAPVTRDEVRSALESLKSFVLFDGFRGRKKADQAAFIDLVVRVSQLFANTPGLKEFDLNPVIVGPKSVSIVDARFHWDRKSN